jgi:hypothetical protein
MRIYHASLTLLVLRRYYDIFKEPLNVLLSIGTIGNNTKRFLVDCRHMQDRVICDSGAWSATHGKKLSVKQVISYFKRWGTKFFLIFNFDNDFSDRAFKNNYGNQLKLEKEGLSPVPVVHNFFDFEIDFYMSLQKYPWLALGSSQSTQFDDFRYAVDRIKWEDSTTKIHLFGGSKYEWLAQTPVASCDTTTWAQAGKFGYIYFWNEAKRAFYKADKVRITGYLNPKKDDGIYHFATYPWRKELEEYLDNTFGFEYGDLCGYEGTYNMQVVNTRYFVELERRVNKERLKRGIPFE